MKKTYLGTRLPNDQGDVDTTSDVSVVVVARDKFPDGVAVAEVRGSLTHICGTGRGVHWRKTYGCHSPDGFSWGYQGSGPAELAAMILLDLGLEEQDAWALHQEFKRQFIATLPDTWALHEEHLRPWVDAQLAMREAGVSR
jgi:hypothetical protein